MIWEAQRRGFGHRSTRTPALGLGSAGCGLKISRTGSRALTGFRAQGHAVGPKGAARSAGAQVAARSGARRERRGGGCAAPQAAGLDPGEAAPPARAPQEPAVQPAAGERSRGAQPRRPRPRPFGRPARGGQLGGEARGPRDSSVGALPGRGAEAWRGTWRGGARAATRRGTALPAAHHPGLLAASRTPGHAASGTLETTPGAR